MATADAGIIPADIDPLESYPGALCRVRIADGCVLARNAAAATLLGDESSLATLLGPAQLDRLRQLARESPGWGEVTCVTPRGRLRLRLRIAAGGEQGLLDLDLLHPDAELADLEALIDLISDARWQWCVADDDMHFTGAGVLRSGVGEAGVRTTAAGGSELIHEDDRERVRAAMDDHLNGRTPRFRVEYRLPDERPGQWRWVLSRGRIVERDAEGEPRRMVGLITDITRRREREVERGRLEEQLRHVQKLDALGQLTGGIAHDFNNILASVLGYAELGLMRLDEDTPELGGYLKEVRQAADRGRDLIARLLTFSRGRPDARPEDRRAAADSVEDTIRMLRPMLPATLVVDAQVAAEVPDFAVAPTQLQQLVLNLVINARDAVGENGHLSVRIRRADAAGYVCASCGCPVDGSADLLALRVADDGPGIPESVRAHVFDPFFSTKERGQGSGLGLSVVHGIVHEHGGHIDLRTGDDGTEITLLLPATAGRAPVSEGVAGPAEVAGAGRRVLVVDDELAIGRWIGALLESRGFVVDVYDDPARALARFAMTPDLWDLVITDQSMPGLSGVELSDEILALQPGLPVIICSGYSAFVESTTAQELGFAAFLDKPASGDDVLATVDRVLATAAGR